MSTEKGYRPKRKIMRALKLTEISAVDTPAQEGARMVLMKRHEEAEKALGLADVFTTSENGHQHGVQISDFDGEAHIYVTHASGPEGESHSHDIMRDANGRLILSENEGHTHELDADIVMRAVMSTMIGKELQSSVSVAALIAGTRDPVPTGKSADNLGTRPTEDIMAEKNADALSAELKQRDEQIKLLKAVIDLTPEQRVHYDGLPAGKQEAFVSKSSADRDAEIEAVEKANPVIFTSEDGTEYRKSDDPRLVKMAKDRDAERAETLEIRKEAENARFEKKAEDTLGLIPGEKVTKVAAIRAISKVEEEETRTAIFEMLTAANKVYKMALSTAGVSDTTSTDDKSTSATAVIEKRKSELMDKDPGLRDDQALTKVLETPEGQALYAAYQAERRLAQRAQRN